MGIDLNYQALPPENKAFKRALTDPEYWESFSLVIPVWREEVEEPFISYRNEHKETKQFFEEFKDIANYSYSLDRVFDGLNFILNPSYYYDGDEIFSTYESRVIFGNESMPTHMRGFQGILSRYSDPEFVHNGSLFLNSLNINDLKQNFDANVMFDLGLYKCSSNDTFERYYTYISGLQDFYSKASKRNYSIIAIKN